MPQYNLDFKVYVLTDKYKKKKKENKVCILILYGNNTKILLIDIMLGQVKAVYLNHLKFGKK